jgi:hypothetical protein
MATVKKMKKAQSGRSVIKESAERLAERKSGSLSDKSARRLSELRQSELKMNPYIKAREKQFAEEYNELSKRKPINLGGTSKPGMQKSPVLDDRIYKKGENPYKTDKNGNVIKQKSGGKTKMKNGGSLTGLKASNKRVGPVDPKGAYTKVQKKTLAGAKGKASLTKDKQLGATKMKMGGKSKKR